MSLLRMMRRVQSSPLCPDSLPFECLDDSDLLNYPQDSVIAPWIHQEDDYKVLQLGLQSYFDPSWKQTETAWCNAHGRRAVLHPEPREQGGKTLERGRTDCQENAFRLRVRTVVSGASHLPAGGKTSRYQPLTKRPEEEPSIRSTEF